MAKKNESVMFGKLLAELRTSRGMTQKEVAARIPTYYADDRSYRRIENGTHTPVRDSAIAILTEGLGLIDVSEINSILGVLGYVGIDSPRPIEIDRTEELGTSEKFRETPRDNWNWTAGAASWLGVILIEAGISRFTSAPRYVAITVLLYGSLYVVSLLLETAFEARDNQFCRYALAVFGLVTIVPATAFWLDTMLIISGAPLEGLIAAISLLVVASIAQYGLARKALPNRTIVPTTYLSHTAQAAHLKNTGYFLFLALLFWLPPEHAIAVWHYGRSFSILNAGFPHLLLVRAGVVSMNQDATWVVLFLLVGMSLYMRGQLIDQLSDHPRRNSYLILFYVRALIYFVLCIVCAAWFSYQSAVSIS